MPTCPKFRVHLNMFRYELLRRLKSHCPIADQDNQDLVVIKLSNNDIQCSFAGWTVKMFRGTELHPPGHSNSRLSVKGGGKTYHCGGEKVYHRGNA